MFSSLNDRIVGASSTRNVTIRNGYALVAMKKTFVNSPEAFVLGYASGLWTTAEKVLRTGY